MIKHLYITLVSLCIMLGAASCVEKAEYDPVLEGNKPTNPNEKPTKDGEIVTEGHVDLGLSVEWAACNLGASSPQELGNTYKWGDQSTNCELDICGTSYDQATDRLGKDWQLPSYDQAKELIDRCRWTYTQYRGIYGYIVTGPSGKAIFLTNRIQYSGFNYTYYWTGTCDVKTNNAYALEINNNDNYYIITKDRSASNAMYIRPVYVGK